MKRIMIDKEKCDGCLNCTVACIAAHGDTPDDIHAVDLSSPESETRNFIRVNDQGEYVPIFCRHCDQPECMLSCMSGALQKDPETGHMTYDSTRCGACFMCVMNCPYGLPKPDTKTRTKVIKCDFCAHKEGPSCVAACPKGAIYVVEVK